MSRLRCARWIVPIGLFVLLTGESANAQWCCPRACPPPCPTACAPMQMVVQPCYQKVAVTEYRPVRQTVRKPVYDVKYVNKPVTAYRPVVQTKSVDVPTVCYRNVTTYRTAYRQCGHWQTTYSRRCKVSPCEYDNRPGLVGWLNRGAYRFRSSFTPNYVARRRYVPRTVAYRVPVTKRVAVRGMKRVTYNITRYQAYRTTQRVAVPTVRMVDSQVTVMKPYTVVRNVPTGSRVAYVPFGYSGTATAFGNPYDSRSANRYDRKRERTAQGPKPDPISREKDRRDPRTSHRYERKTNPVSNPTAPSAERTPADRNVEIAGAGKDQAITAAFVPTIRRRNPASSLSIVRANRRSSREFQSRGLSHHPVRRGPKLTSPSAVALKTRN